MSLSTWTKEFVPKSAKNAYSRTHPVAHSLQKWRGLTRANLKRHQTTADEVFNSAASDCALCVKYNHCCKPCPIVKVTGKTCGKQYLAFERLNRADPMIRLLEKVQKQGHR